MSSFNYEENGKYHQNSLARHVEVQKSLPRHFEAQDLNGFSKAKQQQSCGVAGHLI